MSKKALILCGGWSGHHPEAFGEIIAHSLREKGLEVVVSNRLDVFDDEQGLRDYALVVPCWTMGELTKIQSANLQAAVRAGVGLGGFHGGMGDAFRGNLDYEWMTGGHFVGHPFVGDYTVTIVDSTHPAVRGLPTSFAYRSEQYYLMVDPGIHLLAVTDYSFEGRTVKMPVAWTKTWGQGRVFYSALGHEPAEFSEFPAAWALTVQGLLWAAGAAQSEGLLSLFGRENAIDPGR